MNAVTGDGGAQVVSKAVELAKIIVGKSPGSEIVTKVNIEEGRKDGGMEESTERFDRVV